MTLHPDGKQGVNIDRAKYEVIKQAILDAVGAGSEITLKDLTRVLKDRLTGSFDGSITWYLTTVKLDLEARRLIERVPGRSPQTLRLVL